MGNPRRPFAGAMSADQCPVCASMPAGMNNASKQMVKPATPHSMGPSAIQGVKPLGQVPLKGGSPMSRPF